jgi:hypothetical protein
MGGRKAAHCVKGKLSVVGDQLSVRRLAFDVAQRLALDEANLPDLLIGLKRTYSSPTLRDEIA